MPDLFNDELPISVRRQDKINVLKREITMRRRVYPNFVEKGTMTQVAADFQISVMEEILKDYER